MHKNAAHLDVGICVGLCCVPDEHAVALGVVAGTHCCGLDLDLSPADMRAASAHCPDSVDLRACQIYISGVSHLTVSHNDGVGHAYDVDHLVQAHGQGPAVGQQHREKDAACSAEQPEPHCREPHTWPAGVWKW